MPPCAAPEYRAQVAGLLRLLPSPHPASETLLPRQQPTTGGAATRPPFRPDKSADRAFSMAAGALWARQSAALHSAEAAQAAPLGSGRRAAAAGPGTAVAAAAAPGHRRQPSAGAGGNRLVRGLSAVKDSLEGGVRWLWDTPDPGTHCCCC